MTSSILHSKTDLISYISLLRGINVSGQKKINMKDLKEIYDTLGFQAVHTYIQSGNVIFSTSLTNTQDIQTSIETAIQERYGFHVSVQLWTGMEWDTIIHNFPFKSIDPIDNGSKIFLTFFDASISDTHQHQLQHYMKESEQCVITPTMMYLFCPNGYRKTALSNSLIESKIKIRATTRNWKTVNALHQLLHEIT